MNRFLSTSPISPGKGVAMVRMIIGALMIYHGLEVFDSEVMRSYTEWERFKGPSAVFMVYAGKGTEFVSGILLLLGLLTRVGALLMIGTLSYITFIIGNGKFWYEDQHPFLFVLFGILFLFTGPGAWSLDKLIFKGNSL